MTQHLARLLGPAPSEMPRSGWLAKLAKIRDRARTEMEHFRAKHRTTKRKHVPKRQTGLPDLDVVLYEQNITYAEFKTILAAKKAQQVSAQGEVARV